MQEQHRISQDRLRFAARTHPGLIRGTNEDRFALDVGLALLVVADGIGGHASGEVASTLAVAAIIETFRRSIGDLSLRLEHALAEANRRIIETASRDERLHKMGTTCVAAALANHELAIAHVGDSRAYRWRGGALARLTRDHSFLEEASTDLRDLRRYNSNAITRALGLKPTVDVTVALHRPVPGDRFLLCTDGLTNMVPDPAICAILNQHEDPEAACDALVRRANDAGGRDNITVAIATTAD